MMAKEYEGKPVQLCLPLGEPIPVNYSLPAEYRDRLERDLKTALFSDYTPALVENTFLARLDCKTVPVRYGQDQYRCSFCGMVWDTDEERPPCQAHLEEETK